MEKEKTQEILESLINPTAHPGELEECIELLGIFLIAFSLSIVVPGMRQSQETGTTTSKARGNRKGAQYSACGLLLSQR